MTLKDIWQAIINGYPLSFSKDYVDTCAWGGPAMKCVECGTILRLDEIAEHDRLPCGKLVRQREVDDE